MITPSQLDQQHTAGEASSDEADRADDTGVDTAELEERLDELEAGMKAVASSVEDTADYVESLADRLDDVDAVPDADEGSEPSDQPNAVATTERMFQ